MSGGQITVAGALAINNLLTINGAGTVRLNGAGSGTGGVTLTAGTLVIDSATALGTGTFTINGGSLSSNSGGSIAMTTANPIALNGDFSFTGSNSLSLGSSASPITLSGDRTITVTTATTLTLPGTITATNAIIKMGIGTLALSGSNGTSFTGNVSLDAGALAINSPTAIGTGTLTINGGSISATMATVMTTSNTILFSGDFGYAGTANLTLGTASSPAITLTANRTITIPSGILSPLILPEVLTGSGGLIKAGNGSGQLALGAAETYTGATLITGGILQLGTNSFAAGSLLTTSSITVSGAGSLNLSNASGSVNRLPDTLPILLTNAGGLSLSAAGFKCHRDHRHVDDRRRQSDGFDHGQQRLHRHIRC